MKLKQQTLLTTAVDLKNKGIPLEGILQKCYDESQYEEIRTAEIHLNNSKNIIKGMVQK